MNANQGKKTNVFFLIYIIPLLLNNCTELYHANIGKHQFPTVHQKEDSLFINGLSGKLLYKKLNIALNRKEKITIVVFENVPGSVNDYWNLKAGLLLHNKKVSTLLTKNSTVESGGTDLFLAGKKLHIDSHAKIGVHAWWGGKSIVPIELPKNHKEHQFFLDYYQQIGIDSSFYWFTLRSASADDMHYMSAEEIEKYFGPKIK